MFNPNCATHHPLLSQFVSGTPSQSKSSNLNIWNDIRLQCFRLVGAGLATIALGESVWELGVIFSGLFDSCFSEIQQWKVELFNSDYVGFCRWQNQMGLIAVMVIFYYAFLVSLLPLHRNKRAGGMVDAFALGANIVRFEGSKSLAR